MTYSETSLSDAVSQIIASPAPILFPDRIKRSKEAENILNAASHLATCSQMSPPKLWIVILPLIVTIQRIRRPFQEGLNSYENI